ncbi:MAG: ATP-dependent Clp protease adaptor ClpS [Pirellulales bacterium]|nr:ATP-dependent Clp protease adaptor ClpS [Pirellulales bacterium]
MEPRQIHDDEGFSQAGTAVADAPPAETIVRPTKLPRKERDRPQRQPRYHVILWNDEEHTFEYVIKMLQELFGHPPEKGYQLAEEVDTKGKVIVLTTTKEHAELKRDQIHAYGKDDAIQACQGSMSASIEPETG